MCARAVLYHIYINIIFLFCLLYNSINHYVALLACAKCVRCAAIAIVMAMHVLLFALLPFINVFLINVKRGKKINNIVIALAYLYYVSTNYVHVHLICNSNSK